MLPLKLTKSEKEAATKRITQTLMQEFGAVWSSKWTTQETNYQYLSGKQYTEEQVSYYNRFKRPTNVFNMIFEKLNHIYGEHLLGDQKMRVYAKSGGDAQTAQVWEDYLDYVADKNNLKFEFGRTVLGGWLGMGYDYVRWDNIKDLSGEVHVTNLNELEVGFDSRATSMFLDDAAYVWRSMWYTIDDIMSVIDNMYPQDRTRREKEKRELRKLADAYKEHSDWFGGLDQWEQNNYNSSNFTDEEYGRYRVVEYHEMKYEPAEIMVDPLTTESYIWHILDPERQAMLAKDNPRMVKYELNRQIKRQHIIIPSFSMLYNSRYADVQDGMHDIIPYFPYPYGIRTVDYFGLMQNGRGPQNFINDMMNRTLDIINKGANSQSEILEGAYHNENEIRNFVSSPGLVRLKKREFAGIDAFSRDDPPSFPFATDKLTEEGLMFLERITGASDNMLGQSETNQENASLYAQRVAQAQIKFAVPTMAWKEHKRRVSQKIIKTAQACETGERMLLVHPGTPEQRVVFVNLKYGDQILNNLRAGEYEVLTSDNPTNPMQRAVTFMKKMEIVAKITEIYGPTAGSIIDWRWLLQEADLGDLEKQIARLESTQASMAQAQADQTSLAGIQTSYDLARQQLELEDAGAQQGPVVMNATEQKRTPKPGSK